MIWLGPFPNKVVLVLETFGTPPCDVNLLAHPTPQPKEIHAAYETNRREATEELLHLVAAAMRSVWTWDLGHKTENSGEWNPAPRIWVLVMILWNNIELQPITSLKFVHWDGRMAYALRLSCLPNVEFLAWTHFFVLLLWMIWTSLWIPWALLQNPVIWYFWLCLLCFVC